MARILLLETATNVCSTAFAVDGAVRALREEAPTMEHAALLTLQIDACIKEAGFSLKDIDAVAISRGPGSYTGLRVGASVAKGICYALDKPLLAIDTLLALASASLGNWKLEIGDSERAPEFPISNFQFLLPMLDARRQEIWTAVYDRNLHPITPAGPLILSNNLLHDFLEAVSPGARWLLSGNGMSKIDSGDFSEKMERSGVIRCTAAALADLAETKFQAADFENLAHFEPYYMKPPNITNSNKVLLA